MRVLILSGLLFIAIFASAQNGPQIFDDGWKFFLGGAQGAEKPAFEDSGWRKLDLPHDWSIENIPGTNSPFSKASIGGAATGFTSGGTAWYRKSFDIPASAKGKIFELQFDGVYMNAEVWLNGKRLGRHAYGYTSFKYDITKQLIFGGKNVVSVKVRNQGENSRWYSGSGIYRHVWLSSFEPVHYDRWGNQFKTIALNAKSAEVQLSARIVNNDKSEKQIRIVQQLISPSGKLYPVSGQTLIIPADSSLTFQTNAVISQPATWSPEQPHLYKVVNEIYSGTERLDRFESMAGVRTISVNAVAGFVLNGLPVKLKGGCIHHDNGPLGAKAFDRAEERKIELLKAAGFNAVRTSHNPPSPALLDACDRLGMMVIDEAFDMWGDGKNIDDYHLNFADSWKQDIESMVLRDRHHPSVIMWSTGNEIPGREKAAVVNVAAMLAKHIRSLDSTRLITCGVNGVEENKDPFFATLDVAGYNYAPDKYIPDHTRLPNRVMMATESYALDAFDYWMAVKDNSWVIGDFVWTAFDYLGEASLGWRGYASDQNFYPWTLAYSGDLDICGGKRAQSYYRDVLWKENQISIFVRPLRPTIEPDPPRAANMRWQWHDEVADWTWPGKEDSILTVQVYADAPDVELLLNGKSLGRKKNGRDTRFTSSWSVPYRSGTLQAIGYKNGKRVSNAELKTAAAAAKIKLDADRDTITTDDLSYVEVLIQDERGVTDPKNESSIHFSLEGPGTIEGIANANPVSVESFQLPDHKAWQGKCLVVIRSKKETGTIKLTASSASMQASTLLINVKNK